MSKMHAVSFLALASMVSIAFARTDLTGCTSTDVSSPAGASVAWYVPGTGELCDFLDCGGGAGAPLYNVPGCPLYTGTSTYSPSYLPGYGAATASPTYSAGPASTTSSADWSALETDTTQSSWDLYTNTAVMSASASTSFTNPYLVTSSASASETSGPLICAIASSCAPASTSTYTYSTSTTIVTQTSPSAYSNGTAAATGSTSAAGNVTVSSASATSTSTFSGAAAMETARSWAACAGLVVGIGAVIAAL